MFKHDLFGDLYEQKVESKPGTTCGGNLSECNGMCNGMVSVTLVQRSAEEVASIRSKRCREYEDRIIREAMEIVERRARESA